VTKLKSYLDQYFLKEASIAPLITFRVLFGFVMFFGTIRFAANGWIKALYINPTYYFPFYGFEWVKPFGEMGMYVVFVLMGLFALGVALGFLYRISALGFFVTFTYIELLDKSNYLNHYYFISLVALILVFLPAHHAASVDSKIFKINKKKIPAWCIDILKFQLGCVYFFAGVAKLHYDWLFLAQPLKIWLPVHAHFPLIGDFLTKEWLAFAFAWTGMLYDLFVPFALLNSKTRPFAYVAVIVFHVLTSALFQIGMFPYIMIGLTLIFFSPSLHEKVWQKILVEKNESVQVWFPQLAKYTIIIYIAIQLFLPFRYALYPGELFWNEEGFRFSWRVMLMEKAGTINLKVRNNETNHVFWISNCSYLTAQQEKMMATQPDMILQYVQLVKNDLAAKGLKDVAIFADSFVSLNGRGSQRYVDPNVDLTKEKESFAHKSWILPMP